MVTGERAVSYNYVTVSVAAAKPDGSPLTQGALHLQVSDFVWDTATGQVVVVPPVDIEATGAFTGGPVGVPLLAMDNPTLSTNWSWLISASLPGDNGFVPVRKLTVSYATGADQELTDLLTASTILT